MKRLCPACFTELTEEANYCPMCGKCMRNIVEQTKQYAGTPPVTVVVGMCDSAIYIGEQKLGGE